MLKTIIRKLPTTCFPVTMTLVKVLSYGLIIIEKHIVKAKVNDKIRDQISAQDKLTETNRKRKERAKKIFRL